MTQLSEKQLLRRFIIQSWKIWLLGVIVGGCLGILSLSLVKPSFQGSLLLTFNSIPTANQASQPYYTYDGYYNKQTAIITRDDVAGWIKSAPIVSTILQKASVETTAYSLEQLQRFFKVTESRSTNLEVKYSAQNNSKALEIGQLIANEIKSQFNSNGVVVSASQPIVYTAIPNRILMFLGSIGAATIVAFGLSLVINYFRND